MSVSLEDDEAGCSVRHTGQECLNTLMTAVRAPAPVGWSRVTIEVSNNLCSLGKLLKT